MCTAYNLRCASRIALRVRRSRPQRIRLQNTFFIEFRVCRTNARGQWTSIFSTESLSSRVYRCFAMLFVCILPVARDGLFLFRREYSIVMQQWWIVVLCVCCFVVIRQNLTGVMSKILFLSYSLWVNGIYFLN